MKRWEYNFVEMSGSFREKEKKFNDLGEDGWEFVKILARRYNHVEIMFKREKPSTYVDRGPG